VFVAVDHCSAEGVGIHAAQHATRFEALEPPRQGARRHFGGFAKDVARGLSVRHDHGSQHMAHGFQKELRFLGIASSPAFIRAPEGGARRQWLCGTLHPHAEGEPLVGAERAIGKFGGRGQAAAWSSAACTGSPSRKRTPWITWARRCEPSSRRQ
jgi:hypothetical protein